MKILIPHIPINTWAIDRQDLLEVMQQIKIAKQNDQRVLLHCYHGSDRTGPALPCIALFLKIGQLMMRLRK